MAEFRIESPQNKLVKRTLQLRRSSQRRESHQFLIDGEKEILVAAKHKIVIERVFYDKPAAWTSQFSRDRLTCVTSPILERLSYGQKAASPVAVARTPKLSLERLKLSKQDLVLVLDRTEKPGNIGACLRTAAAAGVTATVLTDPICDVFNPNVIRASRGAVFSLPIAVSSRLEFTEFCETHNLSIFCARVQATQNVWQCPLARGAVIVFGNEATGLEAAWDSPGTQAFTIPMHDATDSLNLSNSAAITLYEAFRQREFAAQGQEI